MIETAKSRVGAGYAFAVAATAVAALLRYALHVAFGDVVPFVPFLVAIFAAGWYGGLLPGLLAVALSALLSIYVLPQPVGISGNMRVASFAIGGGIIAGLCAALRDAFHRLERSQARLQLIADNAPVLLVQCDRDCRYTFINRSYAERFGVKPEEILGRRIPEVLGEKAYESFRHHIDEVLAGNPVEFEMEIPYENIGSHFMHVGYTPERDASGAVVGWLAALIDITQRRRIEEALQASERVLREDDRRKDEFLATLAHELRNPMAPLSNGVQLIRHASTDETILQTCRMMERQLGQLVRLVDDLLDISRVTRGKIELRREVVELSSVIDSAVETCRPVIDHAGHDFTLHVPNQTLRVEGDPLRLAQIVSNLLNNSAKYTRRGGRIWLTVTCENGSATIAVRDSGIGIPPTMIARVFEMFTQVDRTLEKTTGGLGIGLSLVKGLVEMHGGRIEARSPGEGLGSEFLVVLPLVISNSSTVSPTATPLLEAPPAAVCHLPLN